MTDHTIPKDLVQNKQIKSDLWVSIGDWKTDACSAAGGRMITVSILSADNCPIMNSFNIYSLIINSKCWHGVSYN